VLTISFMPLLSGPTAQLGGSLVLVLLVLFFPI
jgi:hypothetical protein